MDDKDDIIKNGDIDEDGNRKHSRIPVNVKIENWPIPGLKDYEVYSNDISVGGIMIEVIPPIDDKVLLEKDDYINVAFRLSENEGYLQVSSQIKWIKKNVKNKDGKDVTQIGVEFTVMPDSIESAIDNFLEIKKDS